MAKVASDVLSTVLSRIRPDEHEYNQVWSQVNDFVKRLKQVMSGASIFVGGSIAKGTWLSQVRDADIFVRFVYERYKEESAALPEYLEEALEEMGVAYKRVHGSRDYFQVIEGEFVFELIPILEVDSPGMAHNITDISPLHVQWVRRHSEYADEIRLMKAFAKGGEFYGAESYIQGFSGYCLEILTIHYGGFNNTLRNVSRFGSRTILDPAGWHTDALSELNASKLQSPLVLVDPVEAGRNVAAAVSTKMYERFISNADRFLRAPSVSFFERPSMSDEALLQQAVDNELYVIDAKGKDEKEDVAGCRVLKAFQHIARLMEQYGFSIVDSGWRFEKGQARLWYAVHPDELSERYERVGPPVHVRRNAEQFNEKYPDAYEREGRLYAMCSRAYRRPEQLMRDLVSSDYVTQRMSQVTLRRLQ